MISLFMLLKMIGLYPMGMALSPNATRVGNRWKVTIGGVVAGFVLVFAVVNNTVTVTQNGDTQETTIPAYSAPGATLLPGDGFTGETEQPAAIGTGAGADEDAIAHWDAVPHQTFSGTLKLGVVAYHIRGINRVEFQAENGTPIAVTEMAMNSDTGEIEYFVTVDASDYPDGPAEFEAIVYPTAGVPRILPRLFLNPNSGGTLTTGVVKYVSWTLGHDTEGDGTEGAPYKTILGAMLDKDPNGQTSGKTIYLMAGDHFAVGRVYPQFPSSGDQYCTIRPAPGLDKDDVTYDGKTGLAGDDGGTFAFKVKFYDVTIKRAFTGTPGYTDYVWYDNCAFVGPGRTVTDSANKEFYEQQAGPIYVTNSSFYDAAQMLDGASMYRNVTVDHCSGQFIHECPLALNVTLTDLDREGNGELHPDVLQYHNACNNVIWRDITADTTSTVIDSYGVRFGNTSRNVAIVNCTIKVDFPQVAGFGGDNTQQRHMYWLNCTLSPGFDYYPPHEIINTVFEDCTFLGGAPSADGITIR